MVLNVAPYLLSLLCNGGCPTGGFWEVILKTGAYGANVVAVWHGPCLEKVKYLSRTTIPITSTSFLLKHDVGKT